MAEVLLGPTMTDGPTSKVRDKTSGKTYYKKRILPEGTFDYKTSGGEKVKLDLTADQLKTFVSSFKSGAYDEVPFQFGQHSNDPTIRKGTLVQIEHVPGKGIDGYFELDTEAAQYVEKYPNFGVSPRLVLGIDRADGKKFAGAIQHVAGTVVPRMTGMGPWSKVELSEDGDTDDKTPVIDLSTETITVERDRKVIDVTTPTPNPSGSENEGTQTFTLSSDEYDFFKAQMKQYKEIMEGQTDQTPPANAPAKVDLSEVTGKADSALAQVAELKAQAVRDSWSAKKSLLLSQGVPPTALDLAEPMMTALDSQTFDLSTPEGPVKVSAREQMLGILETMKGTVNLSGETGHGMTGAEPQGDSMEEIQAYLDRHSI